MIQEETESPNGWREKCDMRGQADSCAKNVQKQHFTTNDYENLPASCQSPTGFVLDSQQSKSVSTIPSSSTAHKDLHRHKPTQKRQTMKSKTNEENKQFSGCAGPQFYRRTEKHPIQTYFHREIKRSKSHVILTTKWRIFSTQLHFQCEEEIHFFKGLKRNKSSNSTKNCRQTKKKTNKLEINHSAESDLLCILRFFLLSPETEHPEKDRKKKKRSYQSNIKWLQALLEPNWLSVVELRHLRHGTASLHHTIWNKDSHKERYFVNLATRTKTSMSTTTSTWIQKVSHPAPSFDNKPDWVPRSSILFPRYIELQFLGKRALQLLYQVEKWIHFQTCLRQQGSQDQ